jgi:hypothetical protein
MEAIITNLMPFAYLFMLGWGLWIVVNDSDENENESKSKSNNESE